MAVIKANFVRRGRRAKAKAKATVAYIQSRPGKDGEQLKRELFGQDGAITLKQALDLIDGAGKGTIFYRLVLSPDPKTEDALRDIDLANLTTEVLQRLEERLRSRIPFAAAEHADHSPNRHVHILALLKRKLTQIDLQFLRDTAAEIILRQKLIRGQASGQSAELVKAQAPQSEPTGDQTSARQSNPKGIESGAGESGAPAPPPVHICPACGESGELTTQRLAQFLYRCASCGSVYKDIGMQRQIERSKDQGLSLEHSLF
jgi:hypothetical protein